MIVQSNHLINAISEYLVALVGIHAMGPDEESILGIHQRTQILLNPNLLYLFRKLSYFLGS